MAIITQATIFVFLLSFITLLQFLNILPPLPIPRSQPPSHRSMSGDKRTEVHGVQIWTNPPAAVLSDLGVAAWSRYASDPARIPWTFDSGKEKMYLLKGKVTVTVDGHEDSPFQIAAGDLVEFPQGMKIVFEVVEAVDKHFVVIKE